MRSLKCLYNKYVRFLICPVRLQKYTFIPTQCYIVYLDASAKHPHTAYLQDQTKYPREYYTFCLTEACMLWRTVVRYNERFVKKTPSFVLLFILLSFHQYNGKLILNEIFLSVYATYFLYFLSEKSHWKHSQRSKV